VPEKKPPETRCLKRFKLVRVLNRHEGTATLANHEQALTLQLGVNAHYRLDVQTGQDSHLSQRWETIAVPQQSRVQAGDDLIASLFEEAFLVVPIEKDSHRG